MTRAPRIFADLASKSKLVYECTCYYHCAPAYENLKRMGRFLHFIAGLLILLNAVHQLQVPKLNYLYFWCQLFIGIDLLIVVFTNRNLVQELPKMNTVFRFIECVIFWGAAVVLLTETNRIMGSALTLTGVAYSYLLFCEHKMSTQEMVKFNHIGITISGIPQSEFFLWSRINDIDIHYDSITIQTSGNKKLYFPPPKTSIRRTGSNSRILQALFENKLLAPDRPIV
ncbi:MAG: hypothetical protein ABI813_00085 [Bacteroidota bacterium]